MTFGNPLFADRAEVDRQAPARFGDDYGCAEVSPRGANRLRRLLIFVTSDAAVEAAKQLRGDLKYRRRTTIRKIPVRFSAVEMQKIFAEAERVQPPDDGSILYYGIGGGKRYYRRCPRLRIVLLPPGRASKVIEDWAAGIRARFGSDRVIIARGTPTTDKP